MLDIIVLGLVPGTSIQITFAQTMLVAALFIMLIALWMTARSNKSHEGSEQDTLLFLNTI